MPRLQIVGADGSERTVELTERTVQIGRGPGNDIVLPDANSGVSRTHAELRFRNGRCVIVDLQSQNGTYLNGERIEHAEIPHDGEVVIGSYRLRLQSAPMQPLGGEEAAPPSTVGLGRPGVDGEMPDFPILRPTHDVARVTTRGQGVSRATVFGTAAIAAALAVAVWLFAAPRTTPEEPLVLPTESPTNGGASAGSAAPPTDPPPVRDPAPTVDATVTPAPRDAAPRTNAGVGRSGGPVPPTRTFDPDVVARRPGESADQWRARTQAFQTRYAYSRAALDRGDFAAAASGFEAILQEEPGFRDVPQLLVRARAGLREVARDVFEAGKRLDAAGDWLGALQKYEQAGQLHNDVRGLPEALKAVREKLRAAGESAFDRARKFDDSGRWAEALKEYEKAVQWLPAEDPRWEMAQSRVERLKRAIR